MTRRPTSPEPRSGLVAVVCFVLFILWLILFVWMNAGCALKSQQVLHVGLQAGDLVSTYHGEQHGGVEANPMAPDTWSGRIALKAAVSAVVLYGTHKLDQAGHGTVARNLLAVVNAVLAGVIVNNMLVMR